MVFYISRVNHSYKLAREKEVKPTYFRNENVYLEKIFELETGKDKNILKRLKSLLTAGLD